MTMLFSDDTVKEGAKAFVPPVSDEYERMVADTVSKLKAEGREQNLLASLDYRQVIFPLKDEFTVRKSDKQIKLIKLNNSSFFTTLRNKLLWGMDKRNR